MTRSRQELFARPPKHVWSATRALTLSGVSLASKISAPASKITSRLYWRPGKRTLSRRSTLGRSRNVGEQNRGDQFLWIKAQEVASPKEPCCRQLVRAEGIGAFLCPVSGAVHQTVTAIKRPPNRRQQTHKCELLDIDGSNAPV